jgi:hypothetical protein
MHLRTFVRRAGLLAGFCLALTATVHAVELGMARVNVLQELGQPASAITRNGTEVLSYRNGVKITLKEGQVTGITGLQPSPATAPSAAEPVAEEPAEPALTKEELAEQARLEKAWGAEQAKNQAEMEKMINGLENSHGNPPPRPAPAQFVLFDFALGLTLKWLLCLAALKLTCKYWGVEVFWSGLLIAALTDTVVKVAVSLIGLFVLQMSELFYADEAFGAIALVLVLRKVSINQSLAQAVQITMTSKVFSIVVGSFVFTMAMHALR